MYIENIKQFYKKIKDNEKISSMVDSLFYNIFSYISDMSELETYYLLAEKTKNNDLKGKISELKEENKELFIKSCNAIDSIAEDISINPIFGDFITSNDEKEKIAREIFNELWNSQKSYI